MSHGNGGKGSARRPCGVDDEIAAENWKRIFGGKKEEKQEAEQKETDIPLVS